MSIIARLTVSFFVVCWLAGCQSPRPRHDAAPLQLLPPSATGDYRLVFPDIVQLEFANHPEWNGKFLIMPDGTLQHPQLGNMIAEGTTLPELQQRLAEKSKLQVAEVRCSVAEYRSRVVTLFQPESRLPLTIPYAGSESVYDLLQRSQNSSVFTQHEITIIRRNTANGGQEERLRVDFAAIQRGQLDTNIILHPNDEIHIVKPETETVFTKFIPNWSARSNR